MTRIKQKRWIFGVLFADKIIMDPDSKKKVELFVPVLNGCEDNEDKICVSDLKLKASILDLKLVVIF